MRTQTVIYTTSPEALARLMAFLQENEDIDYEYPEEIEDEDSPE